MSKPQGGFTIIEVMLFLAISGLIMSVVLASVATGINRERYRDAVNSYLDFWQGQYNSVTNVVNNREAQNPCVGGKIVEDGSESPDTTKGVSDCTIVGRVVHSASDGKSVASRAVYATVDARILPVNSDDTDAEVLASAGLIMSSQIEKRDLNWGAQLVDTRAGSGREFSILIVRMPTSGVVRTFVTTEADRTPAQIVSPAQAHVDTDFVMCVSPAGLVSSPTVGVKLALESMNSSGVTLAGDGAGC